MAVKLLIALLAFSLACWSPSPVLAADNCVKRAPAAVVHSNDTWSFSLLGCKVKPLLINELHGTHKTNAAWISVPPRGKFPPHRHLGREEYIYILSGAGDAEVWLPGTPARTAIALTAGDWHFLPSGGMHSVTNTGSEDLVALVMMTEGPIMLEQFDAWPDSLDLPQGPEVPLMALMPECPPGHEPEQMQEEL